MAAFFLAACWLYAQGTAPPPLVHLYPAALDSSGQPVAGLTAADFKIADQGKSQDILLFRRPAAKAAAAPGPHEYVDRPGGITPHSVAILFDLMNEGDANRLDTWHSLAKSIPQLESGADVYFYMLNLAGDLVPIHAVGPAGGSVWLQAFAENLNKAVDDANHARPAGIDREDRTKRTYHQLEVLSNQLATLPGRRDLVWITNMMPSITNGAPCGGDWVECGLYVPHMAVTLTEDGVAVDPYYASGVPQPTTSYDLDQMALLTGGHAYYLHDIRDVLQEVAKDAVNSYEIAYAPQASNWDGKFHKVHLTCHRKGVKLQVQERYYALRDARSDAERQKEALMAAYRKPSGNAAIGLAVRVTPNAKGVHLQIRMDVADLLLPAQGGRFKGAVTLLLSDRGAFEQADSAGLLMRPIGDPSVSNLALQMDQDQYDAALKDGLSIGLDHPLTAAVQRVRVVVMDQNTNAAGSVTFPVR